MDKDNLKDFKSRLREAIECGPASQTKIAEYCGISVQSVGGWKRTGQISKENLRKLSEISGFRYLYLLNGEEPRTYSDAEQNAFDMGILEQTLPHGIPTDLFAESKNARRLVQGITHALANKRLSDEAIGHLADFIQALVKNQKP